MTITIKTAEDIAGMRVACRLASEVLDYIGPFIKPGITTNEIDKLCHDYMVDVQQCITTPPTASAPPVATARSSLGKRICQTIDLSSAEDSGEPDNT